MWEAECTADLHSADFGIWQQDQRNLDPMCQEGEKAIRAIGWISDWGVHTKSYVTYWIQRLSCHKYMALINRNIRWWSIREMVNDQTRHSGDDSDIVLPLRIIK